MTYRIGQDLTGAARDSFVALLLHDPFVLMAHHVRLRLSDKIHYHHNDDQQ